MSVNDKAWAQCCITNETEENNYIFSKINKEKDKVVSTELKKRGCLSKNIHDRFHCLTDDTAAQISHNRCELQSLKLFF